MARYRGATAGRTLDQRFLAMVSPEDGNDGCWLWAGGKVERICRTCANAHARAFYAKSKLTTTGAPDDYQP